MNSSDNHTNWQWWLVCCPKLLSQNLIFNANEEEALFIDMWVITLLFSEQCLFYGLRSETRKT